MISIIVPCYNQAQYLDECLESVLNQTYINWECIIVNDGSPDNTEEIALNWTQKDSRFKYIKKKNGGLSSARNAGLEIAQGKYIQFLDSDDKIAMQKFEKQLSILNKGIDICVSDYAHIGIFGEIKERAGWCNKITDFRQDVIFRWDDGFSIPIHTALISSSCIGNVRFDESLKAKEDWLFWIEVSEKVPTIHYMDEVLAYYRINLASMTHDSTLMQTYGIRVRFKIISKLNGEEKNVFIDKTEQFVMKSFESTVKQMEEYKTKIRRIQSTKAYRLGKFFLKSLRLFQIKKLSR